MRGRGPLRPGNRRWPAPRRRMIRGGDLAIVLTMASVVGLIIGALVLVELLG